MGASVRPGNPIDEFLASRSTDSDHAEPTNPIDSFLVSRRPAPARRPEATISEATRKVGQDAMTGGEVHFDRRSETTQLSPQEESAFQSWAKRNAISDVDHNDSHYDYRGFWKDHGDVPVRFGVDHFPDTYKQHGHETFSVESKYSTGPNDGGRWDGEKFTAPPDPRKALVEQRSTVAQRDALPKRPEDDRGNALDEIVRSVKDLNPKDAPAPTTTLGKVADAAGRMAAHPVETAKGVVMAPLEASYNLGEFTRQEIEKGDAARRGEVQDGPSIVTPGRDVVSGKEAAASAAQLAALGAAGPAETALGRVLAKPIGSRAAAIAARAATGAGVGATFTPDDPGVGGILGALAGGAHAAVDGTRAPGVREAGGLREHPERLLSDATDRRASVELKVSDRTAPPTEPDFSVEDTSPYLAKAREAIARRAAPNVESATVAAPPAPKAPEHHFRDLLDKPHDEIGRIAAEEAKREADIPVEVFGADGAKRWEALQRRANGQFTTDEAMEKALAEIAAMEAPLPQAQRDQLYGFGEKGLNADELKEAARSARDYSPEFAAEMDDATLRSTVGRELTTGSPEKNLASAMRLRGAVAELSRRTGQPTETIIRTGLEERARRGHVSPGDAVELFAAKMKQLQEAGLFTPGEVEGTAKALPPARTPAEQLRDRIDDAKAVVAEAKETVKEALEQPEREPVRTQSGRVRANLSAVHEDDLVAELAKLHGANEADGALVVPTVSSEANMSHYSGDLRHHVGMKGAAINASGRIAQRKKTIAKLDDALKARGWDDERIMAAVGEYWEKNGPTRTDFDTPEIVAARRHTAANAETFYDDSPEREDLRSGLAADHFDNAVARLPNGPRREKQVGIVIGNSGSGKTSKAVLPLANELGAAVFDTDAAKHLIPEYENGKGSAVVFREAGKINRAAIDLAISEGLNFVFPTVGANPQNLNGLLDDLHSEGYRIHIRHVDVPSEVAARRAASRYTESVRNGTPAESHFVDPEHILRTGDVGRETYALAKNHPGTVSYAKLDNSIDGAEPRTVESHKFGAEAGDAPARVPGRSGVGGPAGSLESHPPAPRGEEDDVAPVINDARIPSRDSRQTGFFVEDSAPPATEQESLFSDIAGTEGARGLRGAERAATSEVDRLRLELAANPPRARKVIIARRLADLERLVNRDKAISASELSTRAAAESTEPTKPNRSPYVEAVAGWWEKQPETWRKTFIARNNEVYPESPLSLGLATELYERMPTELQEHIGREYTLRQSEPEGSDKHVGPTRRQVEARRGATEAFIRDTLEPIRQGIAEKGAELDRLAAEVDPDRPENRRKRMVVEDGGRTEPAPSTELEQAFADWNANRAYRLRNGSYRLKGDPFIPGEPVSVKRQPSRPAPWNKAVRYAFPNGDGRAFEQAAKEWAKDHVNDARMPGAGNASSSSPPPKKPPAPPRASGSLPAPEPTGLGERRSSLRLSELLPAIRAIFHPESLGPNAPRTAASIRHQTAQGFRELAQATHALEDFQKAVGKLSTDKAIKYWDAAEHGQSTGDPEFDAGNKLLQDVTQRFTDELIALDRLKAESTIENYIGRFWSLPNNPSGTNFLARIMGKRPLEGPKSFLKKRSWESLTEGLQAIGEAQARIASGTPLPGDDYLSKIQPATYNYVESQLAKIAEMQRVITAERILRAELAQSRAAKVLDTQGKEPPVDANGEKWVRIGQDGDPAFTIYGPRQLEVREAFDAGMRESIEAAIKRIGGVTHTRKTSVGRKKLGYAVGDKEIFSKFASHDGVIIHELGHIIDERFSLRRLFAANRGAAAELKALADLRWQGQQPEPDAMFKSYVQKPEEQVANALHAMLHAPELMEKVAPTTKRVLTDFLASRGDTKPILDIKPSLRFDVGKAEQFVPGIPLMGHWYAPRDAAGVWNNFLARGLRGNALFDAATAPGQAATQLLLGISGFHGTVIATEGMFSDMVLAADNLLSGKPADAAAAMGRVVGSPVTSAISSISPRRLKKTAKLSFGAQVMDEYLKPGTHPELAKVISAMVAGGFRGQFHSELWSGDRTKALKRAVHEALKGDTKLKQAWGASKVPIDAVFAGIEIAAKPLMSRYVPLMKTAATYHAVAKRLAELPENVPVEQLERESWDIVKEMDLRFGHVVYDNHFIANTAKHLAQAMFLAPGWTFGTLTLMGRGARDIGAAPKRAYDRATGKPGADEQPILGRSGKYWMAAVVGTMALNGMLTYLATGDTPGTDADHRDDGWKDFFAFRDGTKDPAGNPNRHTIPGYLMHDVYGWTHHPYKTFMNKLSPFWAFAGRVVRNETFYGDKVRDENASVPTQIKQVGKEAGKQFAPLSVQNYLEGRNDREESGVSEVARNVFGVGPAKREFVRTAAQNEMAKILSERGHPKRTPEMVDEAEVRRDLRAGRRDGSVSRDSVLRLQQSGELTRTQAKALLDKRKLSESPLLSSFRMLSVAEARRVYALGTPTEQKVWRSVLRLKEVNERRAKAGLGPIRARR